MTNYNTIQCSQPDCENEALLNRLPTRKSNYFIHRQCFPCAAAYYVGPRSKVVVAALRAFWKQTA